MNKKEVVNVLETIGTILELKGENPFKARAYYNGARIIETLDRELRSVLENGELSSIKGIGSALAEKITTLVTTGKLPYYDELKASIPEGLLDLLGIPGLGAKKVKAIYDALGIHTIGELEYACQENRLRDLPGFGQKSQDAILRNIELRKKNSERFLYPLAEETADQLREYLSKNPHVQKIEIAGSLRRKTETVKDIDIIGCCLQKDRDAVMAYFIAYEEKFSIINQGTTKSSIILNNGITAELRLVGDTEFPFLLQYNTGSKDHNTHLRRIAKSRNLKLNEYGLFEGENRIACQNEKEIYQALDLIYIPPELREDLGEIENAAKGSLPDIYEGNPFYGLFHVHTNYSDGGNTISEIVAECKKMNLVYVGITDHSKSAFYANGLSEDRVKKQQEEIENLNQKDPGFKIFKGIEVDILKDGSLDYADQILASFDFVIASVHSQFRMPEKGPPA
jgi:DNA polymerase (family 10)